MSDNQVGVVGEDRIGLEGAIAAEQLRLLVHRRADLLINLFSASMVSAVLWPLYPTWVIVTWLGLFFCIIGIRYLLRRQYQAAGWSEYWRWVALVGAFAIACLWGVTASVILVTPDPFYHIFILLLLSWVMAGGVVTNSTYFPAMVAFILPAVLPAIVILLSRPEIGQVSLGAMLVLFTAAIFAAGLNINRSIIENLRLRFGQTALLDQLKASDLLMSQAQKTALIGAVELDVARDQVIWTAEIFDILGVDPATFEPSLEALEARVHPDDQQVVRGLIAEYIRTGAGNDFDCRLRMDDGAIKYVHVNSRALTDADNRPKRLMVTIQDITEREAASQALAYRDRLLHAVTIGTGLLVKAGSLDEAMPESLRLVGESLGVDRVVVMQDDSTAGAAPIVRDVWQSDDIDVHLDAATLAIRLSEESALAAWIAPLRERKYVSTQLSSSEGPVHTFLSRLHIQSTLNVPVFVGDSYWGSLAVDSCRHTREWTKTEIDMLTIFGDIVGSLMVHAASSLSLEQSEARFRAVTTVAQDAIIIVDSHGRIDFWNSAAERILGYSAEETAGKLVHDFLVPPKFRADAVRGLKSFRATGQGRLIGNTTEVSALRKDGVEIAVEISMASAKLDDRWSAIGILRDVTERKSALGKLEFANLLLKTQTEASLDGILIVDAKARIISFNHRLAELWNIPWSDLLAGDDNVVLARVQASVKDSSRFMERVRYFYDHPDEDGFDELETIDHRSIERHTVSLKAPTGAYLGRAWFFRDITERKRAVEEAYKSGRQDKLTGLANRTAFVEELEYAIAVSKREDSSFAVIYLDLDHFKDVNDTLGHPVGDALLQAVADVLQSNTRETDTVARFGGDEFAVIVADIKDPTDAAILADKLIEALSVPFIVEGHEVHSGASIGIAPFGADAPDAETLLSHADVALYRAKSEGRGGYRFFTDEMDTEVQLRVKLGFELRDAIDAGELFLLYQPQIVTGSGQIHGVEALVRWRHPVRGILSPDVFIPIAERVGIISKLGNWVLWTACRQAKLWLDMGLPPVRMAVNVSALQFKTAAALESEITKALAETGLPPQSLELELTETVLMEVTGEHSDVLSRLRASGITTAIDDFGTGYSSLNYLTRFPSNRVKIAQDFVADLENKPENAAVIKATIGLARELGIIVIAEGVETEEQARMLASWGCQEMQGFLFARPLNAEDATEVLRVGSITARQDGT